MKTPLSWLRDYVRVTLSPDDLGKKLTMSGTEVGAIQKIGGWHDIFVGEVVAVEPHPNAERLKLATVDLGGERVISVCGAPNVAVGQKVPFARIGAELIDPESRQIVKLKKTKIRGVASEGMICSERELGISDQHEGIMVLPSEAILGLPLDDCLGDAILDLDVTPNRPDCLCVIGIAWEVAALTGESVHIPGVQYTEGGDAIESAAAVEIADPDLCLRYCASLLTDVKICPSPAWMQQRLIACGMRPISNIVDVTNYVMLEYGQPLHAFDLEKLGGRRIIVRRARPGETIVSIDNVERQLSSEMLVIADARLPVAIAGVMGGAYSEVKEQTTSVLIESANFNATSLRRTSAELKLRSEASLRFEKVLSPELSLPALRRATQLMAELSGGKVARGIIDVYPGRKEARRIPLTAGRVKKVLGMSVEPERMAQVLGRLGFVCQRVSQDELSVTVPYWRTDVRLADDLVEEIARITGYDEIPTTIPSGALPKHEPDPLRALRQKVTDILIGSGMQEVITYSLTTLEAVQRADPNNKMIPLRVANRITAEQEYMRTTLRAGLLHTVASNEKHKPDGMGLFEVGKVYLPREKDLPQERYMLVGVLCGSSGLRSWHGDAPPLDFFHAKGIIEVLLERLGVVPTFEPVEEEPFSPGRTARVLVDGEPVGIVGELHPRSLELFDISYRPLLLFELDLEKLLPASTTLRRYRPIARFPANLRDIAIVLVNDIPAKKAYDIISSTPLAAEVSLFDVYTGDQVPRGKKSLAFRISYQSPEHTLTDEEVNREQEKLLARLNRELGATLRA